MDLENLMQSLSLHTQEEVTANNLNVFATKINENHTDFVVGEFTNKYMIIATQYEKIGSLLKVLVDRVEQPSSVVEAVYTVSVVFGSDNEEQQAAARFIAEQLNIRKPLLIFLCLKDYKIETVKVLVDAILNSPKK